jgi:hypothetical protein
MALTPLSDVCGDMHMRGSESSVQGGSDSTFPGNNRGNRREPTKTTVYIPLCRWEPHRNNMKSEYDESVLQEAELIQNKLCLSASVEEIAAILTYDRMTAPERIRYVIGCSPADMPIVTFTSDGGVEVH